MKIKRKFKFENAWKNYKEAQLFANEKETKAAFLFGCAAAFHLTTEEVNDLKIQEKQFKALSYMKDQAVAIFAEDEGESGLPKEIADALKKMLKKISARAKNIEAENTVFDLRDDEVEEKFEASLKERREKMLKMKSEGVNFGLAIKDRHFGPEEIDEGINFARDEFYKDFARTRETIKEREAQDEKQKFAGEALKEAAEIATEIINNRKKDAEALADDVQKETPKERGEAAEADCRENIIKTNYRGA